jgi:CubicO group peptidase (beta-lactamase class C family)
MLIQLKFLKKMNTRSLGVVSIMVLVVAVQVLFAPTQDDAENMFKQVDWPYTTAGRYSKSFFEAYNTEGEEALRRFVKEYHSEDYLNETSLDEELTSHLRLRKLAGKLIVHSAKALGDFAIEIIARSELFGWMKFQIELLPEPPHDPITFRGGPTSPPETVSIKNYSDWEDLCDLLEKVRRDSGAPGMAAALVRSGKIVEKAVTGVRRIDQPDRIQIGDRFHIGSVGKIFTGTMIGKLLEDEVLSWDMTIGEILDDIPMKAEYRSVTLKQLLQHHGGVPNWPTTGEFTDGIPTKPKQSPAEARKRVVQQVLTESLVNPGEYSYSNAGYVVAGYMVERVLKRSWEELMYSLVFEPLELRSTGFGWAATEDLPNQPLGHYGTPPKLRIQEIGEYMIGNIFGDMDYVGPAGNLHCSIEDMARFAAFHLRVLNDQDSALKAETVSCFWREGKTDEGERRYCFFGSGGTFLAMVAVYPDSDIAIVAATNFGLPAMPFLKEIRDAIYNRIS